jgi:uncharacterized protein YjbK
MKKYTCILNYETEIEAENYEEAKEEFLDTINGIDFIDQIEIKENK